MRNIIRLTNDFILRAGVHALPLRIDDLSELCTYLGYRLLPYQHAADALRELGIEQYTKHPAFTVCIGNNKAVLFDSTLSTGTRIFAIAHEIGHIVLQHNYRGIVGFSDADSDQEREANTFAYQLIAPLCVLHALNVHSIRDIQSETLLDRKRAKYIQHCLRQYSHQPSEEDMVRAYGIRRARADNAWAPYLIMLFMIGGLSIFILNQRITINNLQEQIRSQDYLMKLRIELQKMDTEEPEVFTLQVPDPAVAVYITPDGEKYHERDCYHIQSSVAIHSVSRTDAEADGYTPCKDCYKQH